MLQNFFFNFTYFCRCDISEKVESKEEFLLSLSRDFPDLIRHDFLTNLQSKFYNLKKNNLKDREFLVCLDYAMNYTSTVQNTIQAHHFSKGKNQATLHPYVAYHSENGKIKHSNFVIISEKSTHDTAQCIYLILG